MTCDEFKSFVDPYVDEEFDERERAEMEIHIASCSECREYVEFHLKMKDAVKACLKESAPQDLRDAIFNDIESRAAALDDDAMFGGSVDVALMTSPADATTSAKFVRFARIAVPLAAAIAVVIALPSFTTVAPAKSGQLPIVEQTVDWHVGNYPIEVTGPDSARVAQWFRNKVDFPVRLPQFAPERRVNLLGGRIAHVQDRRAAYLLYEIDGTRLSVLVFDGEGLTIPSDKIRSVRGRDMALLNNKGYEVALLQDSGVTYTITSELAEPEFVSLVSSTLH